MISTFIKDRDGNIYLNDIIRRVKGGFLTPQIQTYTVAAMVGTTPGESVPIIWEAPVDAAIEIFHFLARFTSAETINPNARVVINDTVNRRRLMNRSVAFKHVFGSPYLPVYLQETLLMYTQQAYTMNVFNHSTTGSLTFQCAASVRKFQTSAMAHPRVSDFLTKQIERKKYFYPFWMTTDNDLVLPASGNLTDWFTTTKDITFLATHMFADDISTTDESLSNVGISLADPETQRPLQNQPVQLDMAAGQGIVLNPPSNPPTQAYKFPIPWLLPPNTKAQINLTNFAAAAWRGNITLYGVACFDGFVPECNNFIPGAALA